MWLTSAKLTSVAEAEAYSAFEASHRTAAVSTTANGLRWVAIEAGGPCSCPTGKVSEVICVEDVEAGLKESQKPQDSAQCPPNAGCSLGWTRILVECPGRKLPAKPWCPPDGKCPSRS